MMYVCYSRDGKTWRFDSLGDERGVRNADRMQSGLWIRSVSVDGGGKKVMMINLGPADLCVVVTTSVPHPRMTNNQCPKKERRRANFEGKGVGWGGGHGPSKCAEWHGMERSALTCQRAGLLIRKKPNQYCLGISPEHPSHPTSALSKTISPLEDPEFISFD